MKTKTLTIHNIDNIVGQALYNDSIWEPFQLKVPIGHRPGLVAWISDVKESPEEYVLTIVLAESVEVKKLYIERKTEDTIWRLALYDEYDVMNWVGMRSDAGLQMYRLLDTLKDIFIQHSVTNTIGNK